MRSWRRWVAGCLVAAGAYAGLSASAVAPAAAPDGRLACGDRAETEVRVEARGANTVTRLQGLHLGPGERDPRTRFGEPDEVLRAQVYADNLTADAALAGRVLAAVQAQQSVRLAAAGAVTSSDPVTVPHPGIGDTAKDSYYAVFAGYRSWQGTYAVLARCAADDPWQVTTEGTWSSFEPDEQTGTALCTLGLRQYRVAYASGSLPFRACARSWW